ncbi:MAG: transglycosylase [Desulfovibrio sp.]|nr:transglycosylase [Desulfovibrio sp.]
MALSAVLIFVLLGCGVGDYVPWPGSPPGGRPAPARRARLPAPALPAEGRISTVPADFNVLRDSEAALLSRRLSPASQSLGSFAELAGPLRHSLEHLSRMPQQAPALVRPGGSLSWGQLRLSAEELLSLLPGLDANPGLLAERFVWYELAPRPLLTGYYAPEMQASPVRAPGFEYPLYAPPPDIAARPGAYERRAVDQGGALAGRGLELAWLANPADVFLLQTEGGGSLRFPDGAVRGVHFAGSNGLPFKGLGQILLDAGALPRERLKREDIRAWCAANPSRALEFMAENRSYVFFRYSAAVGEGALGKPLTPLVSLATDPSLLPLGAVAVLDAPLPAQGAPEPLRGLVLAQDSGADIQGLRLDLYLGSGARAERLEAGLRTPATLHLLVSKSALRGRQ